MSAQQRILMGIAVLFGLASAGDGARTAAEPIKTLTGHTRWVASVAFHPEGQLVASGGHDGLVRLWDIAAGKEKWAFDYRSAVACLAFSPDGKTLACSGGGFARQPDGKQTVHDPEGEIVLLATETGEPQGTLKGHMSKVSALAFTKDGRTLLSCAWDGLAKVWDVPGRTAVRTFPRHSMPITSLALSPDEKTLAVADGPKAKLYSLATGDVARELDVDDKVVLALAWSPDGATVATGSRSQKDFGSVKLWDPQTGKLRAADKPQFRASPCWLAFSPDGRVLASANSTSADVELRSPKTAERKMSLSGHAGALTCVAFSRSGRTIASASLDKTVKLWKSPLDGR